MQIKRYEETLEGLGFDEAFLPGMIFSFSNNHSMSWEVFSKLRSLLVVNVKGTFQILVKKKKMMNMILLNTYQLFFKYF